VLLAGGAGERLYPLTRDRAKPAVPFGGVYRIVDVTLSNCVNSGLRRVFILTQYKSLSLNRHIRFGWNIFASELGEFIEVLPPMQRVGEHWYLGTADAVYQNIYSILAEDPEHVLILAGDHIYKMNYALMLEQHQRTRADVTVGTIRQPLSEATRLGVVTVDKDERITGFLEKPKADLLPTLSDDGFIHASMGIYVFTASALIDVLREDALNVESRHDFGRNILPAILDQYRVFSYNFIDENRKEAQYWRDVGTIDAYYEANMDLVSVSPIFNLYDHDWPIRTLQEQNPPAKFVFAHVDGRMGVALDSIVSHGCIISGGRVVQSVLGPGVRVNSYAEVDRSILFSYGYDEEQDRASGYTVTESGIVVVSRESPILDREQAAIASFR
jgi:glucose-1-phosphate adenylyltransferase